MSVAQCAPPGSLGMLVILSRSPTDCLMVIGAFARTGAAAQASLRQDTFLVSALQRSAP